MLTIKRTYNKTHTSGELTLPDGEVLACLELPWLNNRQNVSCIPEGEYFFMRDTIGRHTYFRIISVDGRTNIEFHPANNVTQLQGCIAPALKINSGIAIASRTACERMLQFYNQENVKYLMRIYS
jgi:hypothetical protein